MTDREARKYPRISVMGLVYLRWDGETRQTEGYLANLSQSGAGLYVNEALQPGQSIDLVFVSTTSRARRDAPLTAWVVWSRPLGSVHNVGVRFAELSEHRYKEVLLGHGYELDTSPVRYNESNVDANQVHEIIDKRLIRAVFQPVVNLLTGEVLAYEALARCPVPAFANPVTLFDTAAKVGRIGELGWVFRRMAIEQCADHAVSLNLRPEEFGEGWLLRPDDPIFHHQHPVYLEITESDPLHYFEQCRAFLAEARTKGVRLAVDDLGAGFSNLRYIADLEPDVVKLDRGLVKGLSPGDRRFRLVKSIVGLCLAMGAKVVAEGIETNDEVAAAIEAGAHYGQGYLFARPSSPPPAVTWPPKSKE